MIEDRAVKRLDDKNDKRIIKIEITEKGKEILNTGKEKLKQEFKKKLSSLSEAEVESLLASLENAKIIMTKINLETEK